MSPFSAITERMARACHRANREPQDVTLIAVTKTHPVAEIETAILSQGHIQLAESRVQEWQAKAADLAPTYPDISWHFIGNLQRNKVKYCTPFALIHSLNSFRLADKLEQYGTTSNHIFKVLIEVNVSGEASKQGLDPTELTDLIKHVASLEHVQLKGLMTMAPHQDPEKARASFRTLHHLRNDLLPPTAYLSMGMSNDFEIAIEEGATHVRIGSALFKS